ncbi:GNAT family N-acetyltransferase [Pseudomonas sp. NCCP-436]|uniref:GNAT family N-acetyltransferase n=1 Tax=Pseudomonas sp. NCCP-436 TaxID=2842481 RepID=UPI001C809F70|nr:N-acetyltransferase [Pseudomonas sp. NCCP-436]GIZ13905.1 GNAT family N-acetyltransferase [Pseudomonas sp. NCCP-436]
MDIDIKPETPDDAENIRRITQQAFLNAPHSDHTEHYIVDELRRAGALTPSLVAHVAGEPVGHIALSPVRLTSGETGWFGLGPLSVLPAFQGRGIGSRLTTCALTTLETRAAAGCVVLGDPAYYDRFGFRAVDGLIYAGVPAEYFQALSFTGSFPRGDVAYHTAFSASATDTGG